MPGVNDAPGQVEPLLELAAEAGATRITGIPLHLRGEVRDIFFDWLRAQRPDLIERYEHLYGRRAYVRREEADRLARLVRRGGRAQPRGSTSPVEQPAPPRAPEPRQRTLF
jgi:DNA repair photolyase